MHSNLSCYTFKIDYYKYMLFYVSFIVNTKQKPLTAAQKMKKKKKGI